MADHDIVTRAIRFANTTRPNSIDNRKAIQLVNELLKHVNELEKRIEALEIMRDIDEIYELLGQSSRGCQ